MGSVNKRKVDRFLKLLIEFPLSWEEKNQWIDLVPYLKEADLDELIEVFGSGLEKINKIESDFEVKLVQQDEKFNGQWQKFKDTIRKKIIDRVNDKLKEKDTLVIQNLRSEIKTHETLTQNEISEDLQK